MKKTIEAADVTRQINDVARMANGAASGDLSGDAADKWNDAATQGVNRLREMKAEAPEAFDAAIATVDADTRRLLLERFSI